MTLINSELEVKLFEVFRHECNKQLSYQLSAQLYHQLTNQNK